MLVRIVEGWVFYDTELVMVGTHLFLPVNKKIKVR